MYGRAVEQGWLVAWGGEYGTGTDGCHSGQGGRARRRGPYETSSCHSVFHRIGALWILSTVLSRESEHTPDQGFEQSPGLQFDRRGSGLVAALFKRRCRHHTHQSNAQTPKPGTQMRWTIGPVRQRTTFASIPGFRLVKVV
jgi:hypothetical protein